MKLLGKCEECGRLVLVARRRSFFAQKTGWVRSRSRMCGRCASAVKKAIQSLT